VKNRDLYAFRKKTFELLLSRAVLKHPGPPKAVPRLNVRGLDRIQCAVLRGKNRAWSHRRLAEKQNRTLKTFAEQNWSKKISAMCDLNYTAFEGEFLSLACAIRTSVD
jgi:hypothetical protein